MHAWVFRHLDQLLPIYEPESRRNGEPAAHGGAGAPVSLLEEPPLAPGTLRRVSPQGTGAASDLGDLAICPMKRQRPGR